MKRLRTVHVPLKEIHPDFFFCFAADSDLSRLMASVDRSGIRTPLLVVKDPDGYRLRSGFRRFRAASTLGAETVPVRVLSGGGSSDEWFREVLLEHLSMHPLTLVEKARALRIAISLKPLQDPVSNPCLALLEIPNHPDIVADVLQVLALHPEALRYVEKYDTPIKTAKGFFRFTTQEQALLAGMATALSLRPIELFEIASGLRETGIREHRAPAEQYVAMRFPEILSDAELNRNQKIDRIKHTLHRIQFPFLSAWNDRLERFRRDAGLPSTVQLSWDESLEEPGIRLRADIRSTGDLEILSAWLCDRDRRQILHDMLKSA